MGRKRIDAVFLLLLVVLMSNGVMMMMMANGFDIGGEGEEGGEKGKREWEGEREGERKWFLMGKSRTVIRTEAGKMRVVHSPRGKIIERPLHIGFLTMEPNALFLPQYLDSSLLIFVRRGEARLGVICKDEFGERRLKAGDIYWIPAGSAFYLVNTGEGQRLQIICSIDPSPSLGFGTFQSFFIGGGTYPVSILSGFALETLATAFNVTIHELREILTRQVGGPIVYFNTNSTETPSMWTKFLGLRGQEKHIHMKKMVEMMNLQESSHRRADQQIIEASGWSWSWSWSWKKLLGAMFENAGTGSSECEDSYNIYDRKPDFRNEYGSTIALDSSDYKPLKHSGIGVYLVNLTAGAMVAPHVNPTAIEYGVVLEGSGEIEIVFPDGTPAMRVRVSEGQTFVIPRYFAFCQIASRTGSFVFFGFTTSSWSNRPQFLVGSNSMLRYISTEELAAAFGVDVETMRRFVEAQRNAVILPTAAAAPPDSAEKTTKEVMPEAVEEVAREAMLGF